MQYRDIISSMIIRKVYEAQKRKPVKNDWILSVEGDKKTINLNLEDTQIKEMSDYSFKKLVKEKVRRTAFQYLITKQQTHSKVLCIEYNDYKIQPYLTDPSFKTKEKQLLFSLRTRMLREAKENFRSMYPDGTLCDICDTGEIQSQRHLLESCEPIISTCQEVRENVKIDHDYIRIWNNKTTVRSYKTIF